jgi:hypothetical protein
MTRKKKSRGSSSPAASTPLKGALHVDGETKESVALQMIVEQMQSMERQMRLQAQAQERQMAGHKKEVAALQTALAVEKTRATQALAAVTDKFQKLVEANPLDPQTRDAMVKSELKRQRVEREKHKIRFKEEFAKMPRGEVYNTGGPETMTINGITVFFAPGNNKDIPACFIEEWEKREKMRGLSDEFARSLQPVEDQLLSANKYQAILGQHPIWNEDAGSRV